MADLFDEATELEQKHLEAALHAQAQKAKNAGLPYTGFCYAPHCGEEIAAPKIFCDGSCAEDYENAARQRRQLGQ